MAEQGGNAEYYFNTATQMVEKGRQSSWEHLMGPYGTPEEAAKAIETAQRKSDAWDESDDEWKNGD